MKTNTFRMKYAWTEYFYLVVYLKTLSLNYKKSALSRKLNNKLTIEVLIGINKKGESNTLQH